MPYVHFTEEQKEQANQTDLEDFLQRRGEKLLPSGREKRLASDRSVTIRGSRWYDHEAERGGGAVSFLQAFHHLSYPDAVKLLLGWETGETYRTASKGAAAIKDFALPPESPSMRRLYAYLLQHRGISRDIVTAFVRAKLLYESLESSADGQKEYHHAVFVGRDEHGAARHAHKRGLYTRGSYKRNVAGSDTKYSFHWTGTSGELYVFEAPIDLLSFLTLYPEDWREHSYVACCGISSSPVKAMLDRLPQVRTVFLCLDNDKAGHTASKRMAELVRDLSLDAKRLLPRGKDWNEDLLSQRAEMSKDPVLCPGFSL